jgi:hypothetical protein
MVLKMIASNKRDINLVNECTVCDQWAAKVLRAAAKKYVFSNLNFSGPRQDYSVLSTVLN